jgi:tRNA pseudouridine38-40 synthase
LPPTIRVVRCSSVRPTFHARHSASEKTYRYVVSNGRVLPPLEYQRAWHVPQPLDYGAMSNAAPEFEGIHDFAAFAANPGKPAETTVRNITKVRIRRSGTRIVFEFTGNGFLYKMVRMMVGLLVQIGRGAADCGEIRRRLSNPKLRSARQKIVAPPDGLVLVHVRY